MQKLHHRRKSLVLNCCHGTIQAQAANGNRFMADRRLIGVLGGMGPLATVDFMSKVIAATPAACDQDHVPMIVYSVPQIPDRVRAIAAGTDEPFAAILAGLRTLERAGVHMIAMPCNTAHAWYDRLAASTDVGILHIADAVRQRIGERREKVALMATAGTVRAGFYQRYLNSADRQVIVPAPGVQATINLAIAAVKSANHAAAKQHMIEAGQALLDAGADRLLLACTELPLAAEATPLEPSCLDATVCLAYACAAYSMGIPSVAEALLEEGSSWTSDGSRTS